MAITLPSVGAKQKISTKERIKYYDLDQIFNLIGEKVNGDSWSQLRDDSSSHWYVGTLNDLIKHNFFDVYDSEDSKFALNEVRQKKLLEEINHEKLYRKIIARDSSIFTPEEPKFIAGANSTASMISFEFHKVKYSFPKNILVPKEQCDYVLKTGKRWMDRTPNPHHEGMIISSLQMIFSIGYAPVLDLKDMMKVETSENLVSYFQLEKILKEEFGAEKWEVKFLIDRAHNKLKPLKGGYVDEAGYAYLHTKTINDSSEEYLKTFYYRAQVDKFILSEPPIRFVTCEHLLQKWKQNSDIDENQALSLLANHLSWSDTQKLSQDLNRLDITEPQNKHDMKQFYDTNNPSKEKKLAFIKEAVFATDYIEAVEKNYKFPKHQPIAEINLPERNYWDLTESFQLVGKRLFASSWIGDEWKFREGSYLEPQEAQRRLCEYWQNSCEEIETMFKTKDTELKSRLKNLSKTDEINKRFEGKCSASGNPTSLKEFRHLREEITTDKKYLENWQKSQRCRQTLEKLKEIIKTEAVKATTYDLLNPQLPEETLKPETIEGHSFYFKENFIKRGTNYDLRIPKEQLNSVLGTSKKTLDTEATMVAEKHREITVKTDKRDGRVLTRLVDTIMKNFGNKGKKEDNWNSIIHIIESSNPTNKDGEVMIQFGGARDFIFGGLTISANKLVIYWKGTSKKSKSAKTLTYSRAQFYKYHKQILEKNGKNS